MNYATGFVLAATHPPAAIGADSPKLEQAMFASLSRSSLAVGYSVFGVMVWLITTPLAEWQPTTEAVATPGALAVDGCLGRPIRSRQGPTN